MIDLAILQSLDSTTIIFGGLTLVSLSLVTLVWRISVRYGNHSTTVMEKNADAWIENARAQQKNADSLDKFGENMKDSQRCVADSISEMSRVIREVHSEKK